jgi:hypothetical protein
MHGVVTNLAARNSWTIFKIENQFAMELEQPESTRLATITSSLLVAFCIFTIFFAFYKVNSARGTDQFWYLSDTYTLVETGQNHSNLTMPGVVIRENNGTPATPFYHNGPLLYFNAFIARVTGLDSFSAWKISNFLFSLMAAFLTAQIVREFLGIRAALFAFSIYLLSPLNIWLVVNSLQETFYAFLLALLVVITVRYRHVAWLFPILLVAVVTGAYSHPLFKLIAVAVSVAFLVDRRYLQFALIIAAIGVVVATQRQLFPTSFPPDLSSLIAYSVPGKSNSLWHQSDYTLFVTPDLLLQKLLRAISIQFTDLKVPPLSVITYLSIPAFFVLLLQRRNANGVLLWLSAIAFALYGGIVVLMQFQVRYQQIIAPVTVAIFVLALFSVLRRYAGAAVLVLALGFVAIDYKLITTASADGPRFSSSSEKFSTFIQRYPEDYRIAFINDKDLGSYLHLVKAANPRQVMVVGSQWLSPDGYEKALELFQPDLLIFSESESEKVPNSGNLIEIADFHKVGKLYYAAE